jgi:hypothetical protein
MTCPKCGSEVSSRFCPACGSQVPATSAPVPPTSPTHGADVAGEPLRLSLRWPHVPESWLGKPRFSAMVAGLLCAAWGVVVYSTQTAVAGPSVLHLLISTVGLALIVSRVRRLDGRTVAALLGGALVALVVFAGVVGPFWIRALGWPGGTPIMPAFSGILISAGKPCLGIALAALLSARLRADLRSLVAPMSPSLEISRVLPLAGGALLGALCLVYALANWPSFATPQSYTAPSAPVISAEDMNKAVAETVCDFPLEAISQVFSTVAPGNTTGAPSISTTYISYLNSAGSYQATASTNINGDGSGIAGSAHVDSCN